MAQNKAINSASGLKYSGEKNHYSVRNREESHETDPPPPPTVSARSLLLCKQICSLALTSFTPLSREQFTRPFISKIGYIKTNCVCAYAQSRLRGQVMSRFHKSHPVCSRAHFLGLYNRKLFCSLNLSVMREGTKCEKENKRTDRRFGIALRLGINFNESWVELSFCEGLFEKVSLNSEVMRCYLRTTHEKIFV